MYSWVGYVSIILYFLVLRREMRLNVRSGELLDQHTLSGFPAIGFYLHLYESGYHIRRDDAPPGGVLCDTPLDYVGQVSNKLESVFGYPN